MTMSVNQVDFVIAGQVSCEVMWSQGVCTVYWEEGISELYCTYAEEHIGTITNQFEAVLVLVMTAWTVFMLDTYATEWTVGL